MFDLENPDDLARIADPMLALKDLAGLIVIDEIQRLPDLFPVLRVLVDRPGSRARYLILGSASPELLRQSAETLAGRILYHYHGQVWNSSEFARSFGVADTTVLSYLDRLASAFLVSVLQPWHENIGKRQVKSPKVYVSDSGLLHALLNLPSSADIDAHPKAGASWEGFALTQVVRRPCARPITIFPCSGWM